MPKSVFKIKEYRFLNREQKFLQEREFHRSRILFACFVPESQWTDRIKGDVIESLRWLDAKNGRPVLGYERLRSWMAINRIR